MRILIRLTLIIAMGLASLFAVSASAEASTDARGTTSNVQFVPRQGIQITRVAMPNATHPRLRIWGYAVYGGSSVNMIIARPYGFRMEASTPILATGQGFKIVSRGFTCNGGWLTASVNSMPKGGVFDSSVAELFARRVC